MKKIILIILTVILLLGGAYMVFSFFKKGKNEVKTGDPAPDFTLASSDGSNFTLSNALGKNVIVLYFYPKDFTSGCTLEACTFRDSHDVFSAAGAVVIGVSSDSIESHLKFIKEHGLPFILLSDEKGEVRKLYGVEKTAGIIPGRVTFVIDKQGIIQNIFSSQTEAKKHIDNALEIIKKLK